MLRDLLQPAFGVAHSGGAVAVNRPEVALAVDQRKAQRPLLRHADQRVVDGEVAVRVVFAHNLADHASGFDVFLVPVDAQLGHAIEDAAVHRLQSVAHIGEGTRNDHAHGVIEIRPLHLIDDGDWADISGIAPARRARGIVVVVIGQGGLLRK